MPARSVSTSFAPCTSQWRKKQGTEGFWNSGQFTSCLPRWRKDIGVAVRLLQERQSPRNTMSGQRTGVLQGLLLHDNTTLCTGPKHHPELRIRPDTSPYTRIGIPSTLFTLTRWLCQSCTQTLPPLHQIHPVTDRRKAFSSANRRLRASTAFIPTSPVQSPVDTGEQERFAPGVSPTDGVCDCFGQVAAGRSIGAVAGTCGW